MNTKTEVAVGGQGNVQLITGLLRDVLLRRLGERHEIAPRFASTPMQPARLHWRVPFIRGFLPQREGLSMSLAWSCKPFPPRCDRCQWDINPIIFNACLHARHSETLDIHRFSFLGEPHYDLSAQPADARMTETNTHVTASAHVAASRAISSNSRKTFS